MDDDLVWEINGYDSKGDLVMKRWPNTKLLAQTLNQFISLSLRTEVAGYRKQANAIKNDPENYTTIGKQQDKIRKEWLERTKLTILVKTT